jgi:hypothetical protein
MKKIYFFKIKRGWWGRTGGREFLKTNNDKCEK